MGAVHAELFIIGFLSLVALSSWIMRLESDGDKTAAAIRQIASALDYRRVLSPRPFNRARPLDKARSGSFIFSRYGPPTLISGVGRFPPGSNSNIKKNQQKRDV